MRAIQIKHPGGLENLVVNNIQESEPGPGQVCVRWHASSLNYHDYLVALGAIPVADGRVPMSDGAGEVIAVGESVTRWRIGDKVMSLFFPNWLEGDASLNKMSAVSGETVDGYAVESSCVSAEALTAMPDNYSYAQASTLPCAALTAWRGLMVEGRLKSGASVLIQGSGGMSLFALQLAKAAGASVFATSSSDEKLHRMQALGADHLINYKTDERWGKTIFKLSQGGVDHVLDVGGSSTMNQSIEAARIGGSIISIGILGGRKGEITFPKLFFKQLHIHGIAVGSRAMQEDMLDFINQHKLVPVMDRSFALEQLADAFRYQESGQHFGKIVVEY
ncbi:MAG: NAD(P)-dependent alcohol dehydrogenase [Gammaproteobacteria bacterium]|nr:NAD(P)-dependent alcohol dehydrogenase [Gammaproteobacteria bacterium]